VPDIPQSRRFLGKACLITGGTSGIGLATADRLAREGANVAIVGRHEPEGTAAVDEIRSASPDADVVFLQADLADADAVESVVRQTVERWGRIDVLVNDAAMMTFKPVVELSVEEWDKVLAVNLRAVFVACKFSLPHMKHGAIVNISSVHAHETTANVVPYAASKGGLEAFTRGLSLECGPDVARVNCVAPGAVDTPMLWSNPNVKSGAEKIEGAVGRPQDLAAAIAFLASDEAGFVNGTTLVVDGGRLDIL
jgi:NAD(P)-dependent dehydrogenase (short-subunit alcohol dehydrogenase family)